MFTGALYESQKEGAQFLCAKKRGILAWEQGTGKTIISIASVEKLLELNLISKCLILAPSAIAWQWPDKIEEFTDNASTLIHAKSGLRGSYESTTPYVVTSYNLFRRDYASISQKQWDVVICDEAQEFKNNQSKTAKLLKSLNQEVNPTYKWALTGTVISNKLEELYSIMYWVDKRFFPPWPEFEKRHLVRNPKTNQIMRYKGLKAISDGLPSRMNRRTQADIDDMPELVEQIHYIEKEKELKNAERDLSSHLDHLAELIIDCGAISTRDPEVSKAFARVLELLASPKKLNYAADLASGLLQENANNRVVLFSRLKQPLYQLRDTLSERSVSTFSFTGDETSDEKMASIVGFRATPSVLLASNAGKAGLDLPFANYLIHIDVPFSYEVLDQRNKRITRAGSAIKTSKVNYLIIKDSIEEFYLGAVRRKKALSDAIYQGDKELLTMRTESLRSFLKG